MITILIPLYNGIEYLPEAIQSILSQTYTSWKLLIGINGHGDTGGDIAIKVNELVGSDSRIKVIIQSSEINNKSKSLNNLIKYVDTEWVALLDADDIWLPTKLEKQVETIQSSQFEVIGTQCEYFGTLTGSPNIPYGPISRGFTLHLNPIINSSVVFKTKYAYWNELLSKEGYEDYELWLQLDFAEVQMYNISEVLVKHRIYPQSSFNTKTSDITPLKTKYQKIFSGEMTCVVTAYYPVPSGKHSVRDYKEWYTKFFQCVNCPVICFCPKEIIDELKSVANENVEFIVRDFYSFEMMSNEQMIKWKAWHENDPEKFRHSPELYAIWAAKQEFVREAIKISNYDIYVWCDIGCFRTIRPGSFDFTYKYIQPGKITCLKLDIYNTIGGGVLAGDKNAWNIFYKNFTNELNANINGKDQVIYKRILNTNNAVFIEPKDNYGDIWFYLTYIFSMSTIIN